MEISAYKTIEKEEVSKMTFHKEMDVEQHEELRQQLEQATRLGNGYHSKVSIYFYDDEGPKRVETTSPKGLTMYFDYEDYKKSSDFGKMVVALTKNTPAYLIYFPNTNYDYLDFTYRFAETRLEIRIAEKFPL